VLDRAAAAGAVDEADDGNAPAPCRRLRELELPRAGRRRWRRRAP
jgi:hypothetical protein